MFFLSLGYKAQHTLESLKDVAQKKAVHESEITEAALLKLIKITLFLVRQHWAYTVNYEEFVRFVGADLHEQVLEEYLKLSESHKNATYLSPNTVSQFVKIISNWMREETINIIKDSDRFTLLLDESTDEANRSELSLIARIVRNGQIENHFLDLLQLKTCDARSICNSVQEFTIQEGIEISRIVFSGMDGCSTMSGEHNGLKKLLDDTCSHNVYIHCRNHRLALCFAHLIPKYEEFFEFDGLLLNLYLIFKHSSVKQSIFQEVLR